MSNAKIRAALATQLNTLGLPTAWENAQFKPAAGTVYLSEALLPNETLGVGVSASSSENFGGIYQVLVHAPAGSGKGAAVAAAEQVVNAFPRGASFPYISSLAPALLLDFLGLEYEVGQTPDLVVRVLRVSQAPAIMSGDRYVIPVSVNYRAFA